MSSITATQQNSVETADPPDRFLNMPHELRDQVYALLFKASNTAVTHALLPNEDGVLGIRQYAPNRLPSLALANKQILNEIFEVLAYCKRHEVYLASCPFDQDIKIAIPLDTGYWFDYQDIPRHLTFKIAAFTLNENDDEYLDD